MKRHLQLFLMFVVVFAVITLFSKGNYYFGKTYYEASEIDSDTEYFTSQLFLTVIDPIAKEDFSKALTVSEAEITEYRTHYGSLATQIQNIKDQYAMDIESVEDTEVREALTQERDTKIADIKKNFEDDAYVKDKIIAQKEKAIQKIVEEQENSRDDYSQNYKYYAYKLKNEKTGETFEKGNVDEPSVYSWRFKVGEFNQSPMRFNLMDYDNLGMFDRVITIESDSAQYSGIITIPKSMLAKTNFGEDLTAFTIAKYIYLSIILLGVICLVLLITKMKPKKEDFIVEHSLRRFLYRLPVDIMLVGVVIYTYFAFLLVDSTTQFPRSLTYLIYDNYYMSIFEDVLMLLVTYGWFVGAVYFVVWAYERVSSYKDLEALWHDSFSAKFVKVCVALFENRSIGIQSLILLTVIFLGGFGFAVVMMTGSFEAFVFYVMLFVVFFLPALFIFLKRMGYLNRIMKHTEDMAQGRLTNDLAVKGKSPLAKHAANLNGLREGVRQSLTEQAKSERMKTELITNVSHDLRTPLTSIITYTDLLKNPDITAEERQKYIGILDTKSNRLKTLIEDLFEVSKMASGNIEITKQRIDLAQLLKQAVGEHEEDFTAASMDLRVNIAEQPIFAYVDGQKWWRVIDNLIINALKYSLEGTRVYVNIKVQDGNAELTVKNVAKYELNEDASELVERFKRADTSRHTEGSGLGLAIAQSIVDLHGGIMDIAIDGDLFKVTVTVRADK